MALSDEELLKEICDLQSSLQERFSEQLVPESEAMLLRLCKDTGRSVAEVLEEFTKSQKYRDEIDRTHN